MRYCANAVAGEDRVACVPEMVKKFAALGASVSVETGAGQSAAVPDADYAAAQGAELGEASVVLAGADLVLAVEVPDPALLAGVKPGAQVMALFDPYANRDRVPAYAAAGLEALSLEFLPRITRAQAMDVLSSQSNLAGYKAVIDAAGLSWPGVPDDDHAAGPSVPRRSS